MTERPVPLIISLVLALTASGSMGLRAQGTTRIIARDTDTARHRGVYELALSAPTTGHNPYTEIELQVTFRRPNDSEVKVDAFYDGTDTFKARAYCDTEGEWRWRSESNLASLSGRVGSFRVLGSTLKGKLRVHPGDPRQLAYDNGDWFLHIGDTGYRYATDTEKLWKEYIDQAVKMGATKIRTWFCRARHDVQVLFANRRRKMNLPYWQEIDRRLTYALENHPNVIFGVIPYGEDTDEIRRYGQGDKAASLIARYAQARFSAFPNVYWVVSNDMIVLRDMNQRDPFALRHREVPYEAIDQMGKDMAAREPWGTLLTNHQSRGSGYLYLEESWSDIIDLHDIDQVAGSAILRHRRMREQPVILDEDRYECYRNPEHDRYYYRRLMWASLLSGGSATYGGLRTYEPYDGKCRGVAGYFDSVKAGNLEDGAHDFQYIHKFFRDTGLTLVNMTPDDELAGGNPERWKCIRSDDTILAYLANPSGSTPQSANAGVTTPSVTLKLPHGNFKSAWYDPSTGEWKHAASVNGGRHVLTAPGRGDWLLLLQRKN